MRNERLKRPKAKIGIILFHVIYDLFTSVKVKEKFSP